MREDHRPPTTIGHRGDELAVTVAVAAAGGVRLEHLNAGIAPGGDV